MNSPERAPDGMLALKDAAQRALKEACATLEDRAPTGGSLIANQFVGQAPPAVAAYLAFLVRLARVGPRRAKMLDKLVLSSYVHPMEWDRPSVDMPTHGPEAA